MIHLSEHYRFHGGKTIEFRLRQTIVKHVYDRPITPGDIYGYRALLYECQNCGWATDPFSSDTVPQDVKREMEQHCNETHGGTK